MGLDNLQEFLKLLRVIEKDHRQKIGEFIEIESIWNQKLNEFHFIPAKFILIGEYPPKLENFVYSRSDSILWNDWEKTAFI